MKSHSYDSTPPAAKDVKETKMLEPGARETRGIAGTNSLQRDTRKGKVPKPGARGNAY